MHQPTDAPASAATASPWIRRLAAAATKCGHVLLAPRGSTRLETYAFGKHPAWRDFIDPSLLPATPRPFQHFHSHLRQAVEAEYGRSDTRPAFAAWRNQDNSALLLILPSHDRPDPYTGSARRSPLFLGACSRGSLAELFRFAAPRLASLGSYLLEEGRSVDEFVAGVRTAAKDWADDFEALCHGHPKAEPEIPADFQATVERVGTYEAAAPQGCFLLLPTSNLEVAFATKVSADSMQPAELRDALDSVL